MKVNNPFKLVWKQMAWINQTILHGTIIVPIKIKHGQQ